MHLLLSKDIGHSSNYNWIGEYPKQRGNVECDNLKNISLTLNYPCSRNISTLWSDKKGDLFYFYGDQFAYGYGEQSRQTLQKTCLILKCIPTN